MNKKKEEIQKTKPKVFKKILCGVGIVLIASTPILYATPLMDKELSLQCIEEVQNNIDSNNSYDDCNKLLVPSYHDFFHTSGSAIASGANIAIAHPTTMNNL